MTVSNIDKRISSDIVSDEVKDIIKDRILNIETPEILLEGKEFDVYAAGGWFNPNKRKAIDMMKHAIKELGMTMYDPEADSPQIGKDPTEEERQKNFNYNLEAMSRSTIVIASTEGLDSGTIWECGYASALGIPVYGFAPLLPEGVPFNLMLAQSMEEVFTSEQQMIDYFKNGIKPPRIGAC